MLHLLSFFIPYSTFPSVLPFIQSIEYISDRFWSIFHFGFLTHYSLKYELKFNSLSSCKDLLSIRTSLADLLTLFQVMILFYLTFSPMIEIIQANSLN